MKKYVAGLLLGALLTSTANAYANDVVRFVGLKIEGQFPVKINGVQLDQPGIVVDGVSYLPTRKVAELFGAKVDFAESTGIELTAPSSRPEERTDDRGDTDAQPGATATGEEPRNPAPAGMTLSYEQEKAIFEKRIQDIKRLIAELENRLTSADTDEAAKSAAQEDIAKHKEHIAKLEKHLEDLEARQP